jgi:hypothetical protein
VVAGEDVVYNFDLKRSQSGGLRALINIYLQPDGSDRLRDTKT